ncbi:FAD:protein FMN transferase [Microbacterium esteraromaticum]|uniref:FAD:protein FMN transferase n=1 Tax=Microbacterium esteraromaticum TaxID=57043 RepID=UPI001C9889FE|nr:FAD:protein FMN transferase [Microbacterium esteraromaticum]MBY6062473.1 FAD:protein FMN transferase [Microbacterium esteraromaticum]
MTWRFDAIGTRWEIETDQPLSPQLQGRVATIVERFDREWSRFRPDSVVSSLRHGGTVAAPPDAAVMLDGFRELSRVTGGAVNPLIGLGLEALGYDAAMSLQAGRPESAPTDWESILTWTPTTLTMRRPGVIDVGALGKGRLVDLVAAELRDLPGRTIIDASGDLLVRGGAALVALEHPYDPTSAIGVVEVAGRALCASAVNRRVWGDGLHHVLDARTGVPVRTWAATWAIADDAMRADAVATALFFDGGPGLAGAWGVDWVRMTTDGWVERSAAFAGELFT